MHLDVEFIRWMMKNYPKYSNRRNYLVKSMWIIYEVYKKISENLVIRKNQQQNPKKSINFSKNIM